MLRKEILTWTDTSCNNAHFLRNNTPMSFVSFGLSEPIMRAVAEKGYSTPFSIQVKAIPAVLSGRDIMAVAQTGTGKTAGFTLPLLQRLTRGSGVRANHIRALVLVPTRELAVQVAESVATYGKYLSLTSAAVYGGVKINPQMMKLRGGMDVLIATTGRLLDLHRKNAVNFSQVEILVLDEADKMLDMGFVQDIRLILALLPKKRQNLLFSATFSSDVQTLTENLLRNPVTIEDSPRNLAAKNVKQYLYEVDKNRKAALLSHLIRNKDWKQVLVFTRTRDGADRLARRLEQDGISVAVIHGDKRQGERSRAIAALKANEIRVLVATDIAARGIDINELPQVVNFDLPKIPENYIHRIGRTGRAGLHGVGISLVSADEVSFLAAIERLIRQTLVREVEVGFVPTHNVPLTRQMKVRPKKPKKNKKRKQVQEQAREDDRTVGGGQKYASIKPRRGGHRQEADKLTKITRGRRNQKRREGGGSGKK